MNDNLPSSTDPIGDIADAFVAAFRQGKRPSVEDFAGRYPEHAAELREILSALVLMEKAKSPKDDSLDQSVANPVATSALRQLGDYQILREVGRGGMGVVYEAQQLSLGRHVAIKVLPSHALLDSRQLRRFQREARSAAKLHHTNIVPVFGVGEQDGLHYYVMQFIQGLGLDVVLDELRRLRQPHGKLTPTQGNGGLPTGSTGNLSAVHVARGLLSGEFRTFESTSALTHVPAGETPAASGEGTSVVSAEATPAASAEASRAASAPGLSTASSSDRAADTSSTIRLPGQSEASSLSESGSQYWQSVARVGMQVADALAHAASQGVMHRDIKPSNLLLDDTGNVWVTDFGLAKAVSDGDDLTHTGDVMGTMRYMAPERFNSQGDLRSDIYSLGLTLYELVALRPAFNEADRNKLVKQVMHDEPVRPRKLNPGLPRDLETVVLKAIARDPAHRYQSPTELAGDLKRFIEDRPVKARRISNAERLWRWCRRNPVVSSMAAALFLLMVGVTVASVVAAARFDWLAREQAATAANERQARSVADEAKEDADAARRKLEITLTDMHTARGLIAADRGDAAQAMLWFANARRLARNDSERAWANRLRARTWGREVVLPVGALAHDGQPLQLLAFQPCGDLLLTLTRDGRCFVWDWRREQPLDWARGGGKITAACWSPDGGWLAVGLSSGKVEIRSVPSGELLHRLDHSGEVTALAFSTDGKHLAVGSDVVRVWDCKQHAFAPNAWRHPRPVYALVFSPGGDRLATACLDELVRVFAVSSEDATAAPLFAPLRHAPGGGLVPAPVYIDHGRQLVTITGGKELTCWDTATGKLGSLGRLGTQPFGIGLLAASPSGQSFAAGGYYGPQVWNLSNPGAAGPLLVHRNYVKACAYSPDGTVLLTVSEDATAKLWSLPEGKLLGYPLPIKVTSPTPRSRRTGGSWLLLREMAWCVFGNVRRATRETTRCPMIMGPWSRGSAPTAGT
jgi:serine/threonine protein kinase/WD40 repeat protein